MTRRHLAFIESHGGHYSFTGLVMSNRKYLKQAREPYTKEGKAPPEVLAQIGRHTSLPDLPSLNGRVGSVAYLASRSASKFLPFRNVPLTGVVQSLCSGHLEQSEKDANALIWGDCVDARCNANMRSMEALPFDCDGGISLAALQSRLAEKGLTSLLYTTFSHHKTSTTINVEQYRTFAEKQDLPFPPTVEAMAKYLAANKLAHLQNIVFGLSGDNAENYVLTASDTYYAVYHDPVEKLRVILFLSEAIPIAGEDGVGIDGYKAIYEQAAIELIGPDALDVVDLSCRNPCQPIYLPAKPKGATVDHHLKAFNGKLWDWTPIWREVSEGILSRRLEVAARRQRFADTPHDRKIGQIADCLKHIAADDYEVWIRCLIAIFNETDGSDEGLRLAHEWSATVPDKYDEDALDRKWASIGSSSDSNARVGLGTLVYLARLSVPEFKLEREQTDFDLGLIGL